VVADAETIQITGCSAVGPATASPSGTAAADGDVPDTSMAAPPGSLAPPVLALLLVLAISIRTWAATRIRTRR
jgi:hypothetical protein